MTWEIKYTSQAIKDQKKLKKSPELKKTALEIIETVSSNPYKPSQGFKKLVGDLSEYYSRRISYQHRFIYKVYDTERTVKVYRMWGHQ